MTERTTCYKIHIRIFVQLIANDTQGEQGCIWECCSMAEMYYKVKRTHNLSKAQSRMDGGELCCTNSPPSTHQITHRRKRNYNGKRGRNILINAIAAVIGRGVVQIILRPVSSIMFYSLVWIRSSCRILTALLRNSCYRMHMEKVCATSFAKLWLK